MNTNVLTLLGAKARRGIYVGYGLLVIVAGGTHEGYKSLQLVDPSALVVALAVLQYLSIPVVALAAVNVSRNPAESEQDDEPELGTSLAEREADEVGAGGYPRGSKGEAAFLAGEAGSIVPTQDGPLEGETP